MAARKHSAQAASAAALIWAALICLAGSGCQPAAERPPAPREQSASPEQPASDTASVHFTAAGDISMGGGARAVLDVIASLQPDLNIALGDLSYQAGVEQAFCDMVTRKLGKDFPYELITGNHESDGHDGDIGTFAECLPNRLPGLQGAYGIQWYVDVPQEQPLVRFILISPGIKFPGGQPLDYSPGSDRWVWTESAIDGARAADIPWTVVGMHTLCFSMGHYGCQPGEQLTNMLVSRNVDLVLTGHEHVYQRTRQLGLNAGCPVLVPGEARDDCVADADNSLAQGQGTVFVTVGVGGAGHHDVQADDPEAGLFAVWSGKNRDRALGTLDVMVTDSRLDARFVPAAGFTFTDAFAIER
ncbi:metallophosphoesterase [Pseudarthrobacter sp. HLT3-5]|uniref:metallophosphoesterase n=1 Tax=Pseudarthrobacter cellobiosi TaxID=2953654 RepID=UPI00208E24E6|nr:metallophosphoesterase [Pseudarthrobacter sp. HLT3-5]MCO4273237.1 metallophosphoesterase [Pseudarthrobacter sp. HLT3-5]